jgi:hypothetical protein
LQTLAPALQVQHSIANLSRGTLHEISRIEQTSAGMLSCRRALGERMSQLFVYGTLSRSRCHSGFRARADSLEINLVHPGCHDLHGPNIPHSTCSSGGGSQAALRDRGGVSRCESASPTVSAHREVRAGSDNWQTASDWLTYRLPPIRVIRGAAVTGAPHIPQHFVHTRAERFHFGQGMLRSRL